MEIGELYFQKPFDIKNEKVSYKDLLINNKFLLIILSFFIARFAAPENFSNLGVAIYIASFESITFKPVLILSIIIGTLSKNPINVTFFVLLQIAFFNLLNNTCKNLKFNNNVKYGFCVFMCVFIPGLFKVYANGLLLYDLLREIFNEFLIFCLVYIFKSGIKIFNNQKKYNLSYENIICFSILMGLSIAGVWDFELCNIQIKNVLSIMFILLSIYNFNISIGCSIGAILGLIIGITDTINPLIIGFFACLALVSSLFKKYGRVGTSLGFLVGDAVLCIYLDRFGEVLIMQKEIIMAVLIFILLPSKIVSKITNLCNQLSISEYDEDRSSKRIKEITVGKLNKFSNGVDELARIFNDISEKRIVVDKQDISMLFDRVADRVCKGCGLSTFCWQNNFYSTYQGMYTIIEKLEENGRLYEGDIPGNFLSRCNRLSDFICEVNNIYELFKVDLLWKSKIAESRKVMSEQLNGLSKVIFDLSNEININICFNHELEKIIFNNLKNVGLKINDISVVEDNRGKYQVEITKPACSGLNDCLNIEKIISNVIGKRMQKSDIGCKICAKTKACTFRFIEKSNYCVTVGVSKLSKHGMLVSGDSYSFLENNDRKFYVALSDGMGSGRRASIQSQSTIDLFEQFIELGFDRDTSIKLINSILVLKSSDDSFATIDLSVIDLYDASIEFVKIGAVPTFIKRQNKVEVIKTISLPIGVLCNIETKLVTKQLNPGDLIIMMTDGIYDAIRFDEEDETSLIDFISSIDSINPQEIANIILERATSKNNLPSDDMLVLVSKIWEKFD